MKVKCTVNEHEIEFELIQTDKDKVLLMTKNYHLLSITPDGLRRFGHVSEPGIEVDGEGKIKFLSEDKDMFKASSEPIGKRDVAVKIKNDGNTLTIAAVYGKDEEDETTIAYINNGGLYMWISDEHKQNCYKTSKDRRMLVLE